MPISQNELTISIRAEDLASPVFKKATKNLNNISKQMQEATKKSKAFGVAMRNGLKEITSASQKASLALAGVATVVGVGLKKSLDTFARFDDQMSAVNSKLKISQEEFDKLRLKAREIGKSTRLSATQAGEGMEMLVQNGLKYNEVMDGALDATVNLALATKSNLATSADVATDAMDLFKIKTEDMMSAVNGISSVTVNSKFKLEDYRLALANAGSTASQIGLSFEDFNAGLAAIAPSFASGSDAGTAFKTMLIRLADQTPEAQKALEGMGLSLEDFFTTAGKLRPIEEVVGALNKGFGGLSEQQRIQAQSTIFGTDALRASGKAMEFSMENMKELKTTMADTSSQEMASKAMDNFKGDTDQNTASLEELQIALGETLKPILRDVTQLWTQFNLKIAENIPSLDELKDAIEENKTTLLAIGGAIAGIVTPAIIAMGVATAGFMLKIAPLAVAGALIATNWEKVKDTFDFLLPVIATVGTAFVLLQARTIALSVVQRVLRTSVIATTTALKGARIAALAFIATPIGAAITAVSVAVGGAVAIWNKNRKKLEENEEQARATKQAFSDLFATLQSDLIAISPALQKASEEFDKMAKTHAKFVDGLISIEEGEKIMVNALKNASQELVAFAEEAGTSAEQIEKFNADIAIAYESGREEVEKTFGEYAKLFDENNKVLDDMTNKATENFDRFVNANAKAEEGSKQSLSSMLADARKFANANDNQWDSIVESLIVRAGNANELGKAFQIGIAEGMQAPEIITALNNAGIATTQTMLQNMEDVGIPKAEIVGANIMAGFGSQVNKGFKKFENKFNKLSATFGKKTGIKLPKININAIIGNVSQGVQSAIDQANKQTQKEELELPPIKAPKLGGGVGGGGKVVNEAEEIARKLEELARKNEQAVGGLKNEYIDLALQAGSELDNIGGDLARLSDKHQNNIESIDSDLNKWSDKIIDIQDDIGKLETKHDENIGKIKSDIDGWISKMGDADTKIQSVNDNLEAQFRGFDQSTASQVLAQEDLINNLKSQLDKARATEGTEATELQALEASLTKQEQALASFSNNSKQFEEELSEARRRASLTEFERFLEDTEAKKLLATEEAELKTKALELEKTQAVEKIAILEAEQIAITADMELKKQVLEAEQLINAEKLVLLEQEKQTTIDAFNTKQTALMSERDELKATEETFLNFKDNYIQGLDLMSENTIAKVDTAKSKLAELRAEMTGLGIGVESGFAQANVLNNPFGGANVVSPSQVANIPAPVNNNNNTNNSVVNNTNNPNNISINIQGGPNMSKEEVKELAQEALRETLRASNSGSISP